ncbi:TPA: hypothetical protein PRR48_003862 [Escherichia coli]|nr:hypothetical protein [Escherichia coli]
MKTMKLNIDLGKYVITGTKHDLILSERGIIKEGENAGKETLSQHIGSFIKFSDAVRAREEAQARLGFHMNHGAAGIRIKGE